MGPVYLPGDNGIADANMEENPAFSSEMPLDSTFGSSEGFLGTSGDVIGESAEEKRCKFS